MIRRALLYIFFPLNLIIAQSHDQIQIANEYYQQGDLEKARMLYEDLSDNPYNLQLIAGNYLTLLKATGDFDVAEKFLQRSIKTFPSNMQFKANLAAVYNESGNTEKLNSYIKDLTKESKSNPFQLSILAQYFANEQLYEESIRFFKESREARNNPTVHALELASIYRMVNDKASMIEEYLNYASDSPNRLSYIKNLLQNFIQQEEDLNELENTLIRKMQEEPDDTKFAELLLWVELQRKNFYGAFIQARAIDKRNQRPGDRSMDIGRIAMENNSYDDAEEIFEYVARQYPNSRNYQFARKLWMDSKEQKIKNTYPINKLEIRELANQYQALYDELYPSQTAFDALRSKALLHAFYLDEIDFAAQLLNKLVTDPRAGRQLLSQSKLDLGDIYLLRGEPWEATLLYSQVEKAYKSHQLGYDAKLRNARLHYFTGNFALAKGHLDILKKNTTREISNDAISLGMLITDNTALDTTDAVMQEFANIELLIFQNKKAEANQRLSVMLEQYMHHSITDEIFWLKSKLELENGNTISAIEYLDKILASYAYDILADDAAFKKAEIVEQQLKDVEQAKSLYQQFLVEYPGSMYSAEARKRFRQLRGDFVN
ncbi:Tetratricopeptide repeat-containing protein [Ekhidna lutea]|uniref:Tetratricopeptide repeat-containing protein n=1 Tax=Ekhidna lutea TaxID=447679 RepID=A0A239EQY4_EKHLU|nr:tetratricopeptide repeat protein [Ekhidna lutea]SNS46274.1 Tetratricopeptide repeat-containing protein [Ekhidna lutea]